MTDLFEGFDLRMIETDDVTLRVRVGGSGPGLLLLHGHPQTHLMWHRVAPTLAERFTVVAPDLRGYGDSTAPAESDDHGQASKRAMARDNVQIMATLGFDRFAVAGHDRGGRVAYRMALDYPERVDRLAVLDMIPTGEVLGRLTVEVARAYAGWFFLGQPAPFPETIVGQNPAAFYYGGREHLFHPDALTDYLRCVSRPETIHTMCEDQRAAFSFDRPLDDADRGQRRITCPTLALWATNDDMGKLFDVLPIWRDWADDVSGQPIAAGHFLAEENPAAVLAALTPFLLGPSDVSV